jgi:hypothetical protein
MSKEIEEMAKVYEEARLKANETIGSMNVGAGIWYSKAFYNAGYRKQEWISVENRLPEESGKYLVCIKSGNVYQTKFYSYPKDKGGHWGQKDKGRSITHWMPLPEPPKGGE